MALHGSLLTMPLADLLSWLKTTDRSGLLTLFRAGNEWELVVNNGSVTGYGGPELRDNLGYIIVTSGLLSEDDLRLAYQHQRAHGGSLQRALLDKHLISSEALAACLTELATESIYDLFLDLPGDFVFSERSDDGLALDIEDTLERLPLALNINHLLMEGVQRQDEWEHIRERFPTDDLLVELVDDKLPDFESLKVRDRRILASLTAGQSLTDLCFELRTPIPSVLRTLAHFEEAGAIKITQQKDAPKPDTNAAAGRVATLVDQANVLRQSGQFNEAIALLEVAVRMRPDAENARVSLKEALEEQIRDLYNQLPPVKVPVLIAGEDRLARLKLRPEERFLLDRLSAHMDIGSLIMVSSLNERETLKVLRKLLHSGIIELQ